MTVIQGALFSPSEVPEPPREPQPAEVIAWNYVCHMFQATGPPMWKLGFTEASPLKRAKQIACTPVAWWHGTEMDEHRMHRMWKHHRVSPAAEFFYQDGDELDRDVLRHIKEMPDALIAMQLEVFARIEVRYHDECGGRLSNQLLMDVLTAFCGRPRTQTGEALVQRLLEILFSQIETKSA